MDPDLEQHPTCYICTETEPIQDLCRPCKCKGTMGWIHSKCVMATIFAKHSMTCPTCKGQWSSRWYHKRYPLIATCANSFCESFIRLTCWFERHIVTTIFFFLCVSMLALFFSYRESTTRRLIALFLIIINVAFICLYKWNSMILISFKRCMLFLKAKYCLEGIYYHTVVNSQGRL